MTLPSGTRGDVARQPPQCYVPATFDPDRHQALERQLHRLVGAVQWLEREVKEQRDCHSTLAQAAVLESELREIVAMLIDGHLRHCVTQAIERRQPADEIARMLAPIQSILFTSHH